MATLIIIPAYNEGSKIGEVVDAVMAVGQRDILVIDDGSADDTFAQASVAGAAVLRHAINRGQGAALRTGIAYAIRHGYDAAVFFDADGQMMAEEINILLDKLSEGYDVVLGSRNLGQAVSMPKIKKLIKFAALVFTRLTTGLRVTDTHIGFQAWTIPALRKIVLDQDRMAHASQLLSEISRLRLKYAEVPVTIKYTDYSVRKGQKLSNVFGILWDLIIK